MSDTDPLKSKLDYEKSYQKKHQADGNASKNYKFQAPLAIHITRTFDPNKGTLAAWTKLLTSQHRELNCILVEHGIHPRTDWSILNSHSPTRVRRLLAGILTAAEIQLMCVVLESYHAVYRQARRQTPQAGKPCKDPNPDQLEAMVCDLQQRGIEGYSPEQVMQTLRFLALQLRHKRLELGKSEDSLQRYQPYASVEEQEQALFRTISRNYCANVWIKPCSKSWMPISIVCVSKTRLKQPKSCRKIKCFWKQCGYSIVKASQ
ncbi:MAG: hypothetical protein HC827_01860 [Cyanobacteria bacterium RM1_2_2]|nr:hypothetical protein [Cyanobacteria bacterium RM1_2_2]